MQISRDFLGIFQVWRNQWVIGYKRDGSGIIVIYPDFKMVSCPAYRF